MARKAACAWEASMSEMNGPTLVHALLAVVAARGATAALGVAGGVLGCSVSGLAEDGGAGSAVSISTSLASAIGRGRTVSGRAKSMSLVLPSMSCAQAKY